MRLRCLYNVDCRGFEVKILVLVGNLLGIDASSLVLDYTNCKLNVTHI